MTKENMKLALKEAKKAMYLNEVPVACVITKNDQVIALAHNTKNTDLHITSHAEINALNKAIDVLGRNVLDDCEMYVTCEPCLMCTGAILQARIKRLYYGCNEPKFGAHVSKYVLLANESYNHKIEVYDGYFNEESKELLGEFFKDKR